MSKQAFKYRIYPTKKQEKLLFWTLARCRELYNAALSERKDAYKYEHKSITYRKVRNQRHDALHKASRKLVDRYQVIVFEDIQAANLVKRPKAKQDEDGKYLPNGASAKAGLNKSIQDASWGQFAQMTIVKAACAGRVVLFVNPHQTSQICSGCGAVVKKDLSERWHSCDCGTELDRDTNAAINILRLGHEQLARKEPTRATA